MNTKQHRSSSDSDKAIKSKIKEFGYDLMQA